MSHGVIKATDQHPVLLFHCGWAPEIELKLSALYDGHLYPLCLLVNPRTLFIFV